MPFVPVDTFILKVASRCNIACKYCYMYMFEDQSFNSQPLTMSTQTAHLAAQRIHQHVTCHALPQVNVILHGGEPLTAGYDFFQQVVPILRDEISQDTKLTISMQTNGILLNKRWLDILAMLDVKIGISLDGLPGYHDELRVTHNGKGTYHLVRRAIDLCQSDPRFAGNIGLLSVINPHADPLATFHHFLDLGVQSLDFLFPDQTYETYTTVDGTPYADWLIAIFDEWLEMDDPAVAIRIFYNFIGLLFGIPQHLDIWSTEPISSAVIETDGDIEPLDVLKICGHNFTKVGLNVRTNKIDDLYNSNLLAILQGGYESLCSKCQECDIMEICGGGYVPWRYAKTNGFNNPAVYCRDLYKLISHIRGRVRGKLLMAVPT